MGILRSNALQDDAQNVELAGLVEGIRLPPQPRVVISIQREMQQEDPAFNRIVDLIGQDAALAAKVLKVVNSPLFGNRETTSLNTAISLLGMKNFYSLILTSALKEAVGVDEVTERLWEHTLVVARLCEEIAKRVSGLKSESAYMAGLFHDAAIPLLMTRNSRFIEVLEMTVARGGEIQHFEETNFFTHHAVVGYLLAKSWGLSDEVCEAIQFHHAADLSIYSSDQSRRLGACLCLADHLARVVSDENSDTDFDDPQWQAIGAQVLVELDMLADDLAEFQELAGEYSAMG